MQYFIKIAITSILVILISEVSKRNLLAGSLLASIPLISVLSMILMNYNGASKLDMAGFSYNVFWLVIPSLSFFLIFPVILKRGINFYPAMVISILTMIILYGIEIKILKIFNVKI